MTPTEIRAKALELALTGGPAATEYVVERAEAFEDFLTGDDDPEPKAKGFVYWDEVLPPIDRNARDWWKNFVKETSAATKQATERAVPRHETPIPPCGGLTGSQLMTIAEQKMHGRRRSDRRTGPADRRSGIWSAELAFMAGNRRGNDHKDTGHRSYDGPYKAIID